MILARTTVACHLTTIIKAKPTQTHLYHANKYRRTVTCSHYRAQTKLHTESHSNGMLCPSASEMQSPSNENK